jgi:hypothetical protein
MENTKWSAAKKKCVRDNNNNTLQNKKDSGGDPNFLRTNINPLEFLSTFGEQKSHNGDFPTFYVKTNIVEGLDNININPDLVNLATSNIVSATTSKKTSTSLGPLGKLDVTDNGIQFNIGSGNYDLLSGLSKEKDYADGELNEELENNQIGFFNKTKLGGCLGGEIKTLDKTKDVIDKDGKKINNTENKTFTGQMNESIQDISNNISENPIFQFVKNNLKYIQYPFIYYKWSRQKLGIKICKGITTIQKVKNPPNDREMKLVNAKIGSILALLMSIFITYNWFFLMFYEFDSERIQTWNISSKYFKNFSPLLNFMFEFTMYPLDCLNWFMLYLLPKMMKRYLQSTDLIFLVMYITIYKIVNTYGNSVIDLFYDSLKILFNHQLKPWDQAVKHKYSPSSTYKGPVDISGNIYYSPTLRTFWFFHMLIFGAQIPSFIPSFYKSFYDPNITETLEEKEARIKSIVDVVVPKDTEERVESETLKNIKGGKTNDDIETKIKQLEKDVTNGLISDDDRILKNKQIVLLEKQLSNQNNAPGKIKELQEQLTRLQQDTEKMTDSGVKEKYIQKQSQIKKEIEKQEMFKTNNNNSDKRTNSTIEMSQSETFDFIGMQCDPTLITEEEIKNKLFKEGLKEWMVQNKDYTTESRNLWINNWKQNWKNDIGKHKPALDEFIKKCKETTPKKRGRISTIGTTSTTISAAAKISQGTGSTTMMFLSGAKNKLTDIIRFAISHYFVTIAAISVSFYLLFYSFFGIIKFSQLNVISTIFEIDKYVKETSTDDYMARCGIESRCTGTFFQWMYDILMWFYHKAIQNIFKHLYFGSFIVILLSALKNYSTEITSSKQLKSSLNFITVITGILIIIVYSFKTIFFDKAKNLDSEEVKNKGMKVLVSNNPTLNKQYYDNKPKIKYSEKIVEKTIEKKQEKTVPVPGPGLVPGPGSVPDAIVPTETPITVSVTGEVSTSPVAIVPTETPITVPVTGEVSTSPVAIVPTETPITVPVTGEVSTSPAATVPSTPVTKK